MILADENVHGSIIEALRTAGFNVTSVAETSSGIKDENVIQLALHSDSILLTEDKDFGEWVFAHHIQNLNVLFLRYEFYEFDVIAQTVINLLNSDQLVRPFFATITPKKIRIRSL